MGSLNNVLIIFFQFLLVFPLTTNGLIIFEPHHQLKHVKIVNPNNNNNVQWSKHSYYEKSARGRFYPKSNKNKLRLNGGASSASDDEGIVLKITKYYLTRAYISILAHAVIAYFSIKEVIENWTKINHVHGLAILAIVRILPSLAEFQWQADEVNEGLETVHTADIKWTSISMVRSFILSPFLGIFGSLITMFVAAVEIVKDMKPGGHHGLALLALSTLQSSIRRFQHMRNNNSKEVPSNNKRRMKSRLIISWIYKMKWIIPISAAAFAAYELYEDLKPGVHHGVAMMALSEMVENIDRGTINN